VRTFMHGGGMDGVSTWTMLIPAKRTVIAGLCSTQVDLPGRVSTAILQEFLPDLRSRIQPRYSKRPEVRPVPQKLAGKWRGTIYTHSAQLPFRLTLRPREESSAQVGAQAEAIANAVWIDGRLSGSFWGDIGSDDVRRPHRLRFDLTQRSANSFDGPITAFSYPAGRLGDALASFVSIRRELKRQQLPRNPTVLF
jgi:hypothetical protein